MPRMRNAVAIHLEKARDSGLLAVEIYNKPRTSFRSGAYIVMMCIAWTALFHAIFFKRRVKPFYRKKSNRRHFEILDGDKKAWELSTCIAEFWGSEHPPVRLNLQFFVGLRNKIEHRSMSGLDIDIFGECQALLFNFEDLITQEFGSKYALNESLSLALQFSCHRNEQQQLAVRKLHKALARDILAYIDAFRTSLTYEQLQDMKFSYKVFLIPKPANRENSADLAVEFIKYDANNAEEMRRINKAVALIKPPITTLVETSGRLTNAPEGVPVRIVTDLNAPALRAVDHDVTHPYRQKDLISRIKALVPQDVKINTYDLTAVRHVFNVAEDEEYYHKPRFSSAQYSEAYAQWIANSYGTDPNFFSQARSQYHPGTH
ncbi:MAG: DUF3644 domain-containing protein [Acidobacteriaceae bacterium]